MSEWHLERLGWRAFQDLCGSVAREVLGQTAQTFEDGNDAGRDGAFWGTWSDTVARESLRGAFVLQAKFVSRKQTLSLSDLDEELTKIPGLVSRGLCDVYVLMTNARVTAESDAAIVKAIKKAGAKEVRVWARSWIGGQLDESSKLRRLVPRVYGLGDLTSILDARRLAQAEAVLTYLGSSAATFVGTGAYYRALDALNDAGMVLLLGGPTVGKSVIAQMLTLGAIDAHKAEPLKVTSAQEFLEAWNPEEDGRRIYWIDDAFGDLDMQPELVNSWLRNMPALLTALSAGSRFVFTSRDYIYRAARDVLKESAYPIWRDSRIEVEVADLSDLERARILYTHIKLGRQPSEFKAAIKGHLDAAAQLEGFTPGLAARLGDPAFTTSLDPTDFEEIQEFFDNPTDYLREVIVALGSDSRAALAYLYADKGETIIPVPNPGSAQLRLAELGSSLGALGPALKALDGTFARSVQRGAVTTFEFWHPTIRQAVATILQEDAASVRSLVDGTDDLELPELIDLRSPASVPVVERGRYLLVGEDLQLDILKRLGSVRFNYQDRFSGAGPKFRADLAQLLATRASPDFRKAFVKLEGIDLLQWTLSGFAYAKQGLRLYSKLNQEKLLPPQTRDAVVDRIRDDALGLETTYWIDDPSVEDLLGTEEYESLLEEIADTLRGSYGSVLDALRDSWETSISPDGHLEEARGTLSEFEDKFSDKPDVAAAIAKRFDELDELQRRMEEDYIDRSDYDYDQWREERDFGRASETESSVDFRSMFDDVDT